MKVKVNLISKSRKITRNKTLVMAIMRSFFIFIFLIFLTTVGFVTYQAYAINSEIKIINLKSLDLSSQIRSKNEDVNNYVLSKAILEYFLNIENSKFDYKKYLDSIISVLPSSVVLVNVDFQEKGWVSASIFVPNLLTFKTFEDRITDLSILDQSVFSSVFSEGLSRATNGGYSMKLKFEIKKDV